MEIVKDPSSWSELYEKLEDKFCEPAKLTKSHKKPAKIVGGTHPYELIHFVVLGISRTCLRVFLEQFVQSAPIFTIDSIRLVLGAFGKSWQLRVTIFHSMDKSVHSSMARNTVPLFCASRHRFSLRSQILLDQKLQAVMWEQKPK